MGLRESKKVETRREIADTAMRLFVQRGFDHVTVAEVAAAARVSEKTVFNYFPTKEDLFFDEVPARQAAIVAALRGRAPGESVVAALRRLQAGECPRLCSPGFATFARIIEESPTLQANVLPVWNRTPLAAPLWAPTLERGWPLAVSQKRTVPPAPVLASSLPSALNATPVIFAPGRR